MLDDETVSSESPVVSTAISNGYRNDVSFILTLIYAFNFIDRQIIGILWALIKAGLGLDNAQLGWLKSIPFGIMLAFLHPHFLSKMAKQTGEQFYSGWSTWRGIGTIAQINGKRIGPKW